MLLALDRKNHEREMVSVLLATLYPKPLSQDKLSEGFTALMLACEVNSHDLLTDLRQRTNVTCSLLRVSPFKPFMVTVPQ